MEFTHFDEQGNARMVDVTAKGETVREAVAKGRIRVSEECFGKIKEGTMAKGDVLGVARIAGIMGAKRTSELIPLCHILNLTKLNVDFNLHPETCEIEAVCTAKTTGKTGIFAYNDRRAVQMMGILQKMKIRVPEQVGIVGFDNIYLCEVLYPSLSSIAQPNETMASLAVQRLLYRMDHPNDQKSEDHPLHAELICRQSSDLKGVQQA